MLNAHIYHVYIRSMVNSNWCVMPKAIIFVCLSFTITRFMYSNLARHIHTHTEAYNATTKIVIKILNRTEYRDDDNHYWWIWNRKCHEISHLVMKYKDEEWGIDFTVNLLPSWLSYDGILDCVISIQTCNANDLNGIDFYMFVRLPLHAIIFIADNFISAQTPTQKSHWIETCDCIALQFRTWTIQPTEPFCSRCHPFWLFAFRMKQMKRETHLKLQ